MPPSHHKNGFTLVELSIVIVLLGLLIGGVLGGRTLLRAAELRGVTREFETFQTAVLNFQDKYEELPGDMRRATTLWGALDADPDVCPGIEATGKATCNGNGDGLVMSEALGEKFRFWQHLSNAGLIQGQFVGVAGPSGANHHVIGWNVPESDVERAGWSVNQGPVNSFTAGSPYWNYINRMLIIGAATTDDATTEGAFTPDEVWSLDSKLDDGKPGTGAIQSVFWNDDCTDAGAQNEHETAQYALSSDSKDCAIAFPNAF